MEPCSYPPFPHCNVVPCRLLRDGGGNGHGTCPPVSSRKKIRATPSYRFNCPMQPRYSEPTLSCASGRPPRPYPWRAEFRRHLQASACYRTPLLHYSGFYFPSTRPVGRASQPRTVGYWPVRTLNQRYGQGIPESHRPSPSVLLRSRPGNSRWFTFMLQDRSGGSLQQLYGILWKN